MSGSGVFLIGLRTYQKNLYGISFYRVSFFFLVKFVWWRYVVQCALLVVGAFKREIRTINMAFINNMISFSTF